MNLLVLSLKRRDHESCMLPVMAGTMVSTCLNTICFAIKQCNLHPTSPQNMVLAAKRNAWMNLRWAFWNIGLCTLEACRKDCRLFGEGGWTAALCSTSATEECRKSPPSTEPQEHVTLTRQVRYGRYLVNGKMKTGSNRRTHKRLWGSEDAALVAVLSSRALPRYTLAAPKEVSKLCGSQLQKGHLLARKCSTWILKLTGGPLWAWSHS
eukprot:s7527_g2.t1